MELLWCDVRLAGIPTVVGISRIAPLAAALAAG
jgi:hypothetical protein